MQLKEMPNTVVHCPNKETYDRLMQIYKEAGWKWLDGETPGEYKSDWFHRNGDSLIDVQDHFTNWENKRHAAHKRIISFADFLREQGIEEQPKPEDLKPGDWVNGDE